MTRVEYDLLRKQEPHLRLPHWVLLKAEHRAIAKELTSDEMIARRTAVLLGRDWPQLSEQDWNNYLATR